MEVLTCGLREVPLLSKYVLVISDWHGSLQVCCSPSAMPFVSQSRTPY